jgi:hypothetical protein
MCSDHTLPPWQSGISDMVQHVQACETTSLVLSGSLGMWGLATITFNRSCRNLITVSEQAKDTELAEIFSLSRQVA